MASAAATLDAWDWPAASAMIYAAGAARRRVAITGIGLTAIGSSRDETWAQLIRGTCGIRPLPLRQIRLPEPIAAQVEHDRSLPLFTPLLRRRWSRGDHFAVHAATEALDDSGIMAQAPDPTRIGVVLGAGTADLLRTERYVETLLKKGIDRARPSEVWNHF